MVIHNQTKNTIIAQHAKLADTFVSRMVGLLNRTSLEKDEALLITRCTSIHMMFMKFAIDVIFVNKDDEVVGLIENIKPFRLSKIYFKASYAIEVPVGVIKSSLSQVGDKITLNNS